MLKKRQLTSLLTKSYLKYSSTHAQDDLFIKTFTDGKLSYANTVCNKFFLQSDTIGARLAKWSQEAPKHLAYNFPHNKHLSLSFIETKQRVDTIAQNLLSLGFKKNDRIAFILPNTHELLVAFLAASSIGLISVLLNPGYQLVEIEYMLKKTNAKGVVMYDCFKMLKHYEIIKQICPELDTCVSGELNSTRLPNLKHIFLLNSPLLAQSNTYKGTWSFDRLTKSVSIPNQELPRVCMDDTCMILFTSGTTGKPKGAYMSHGNILNTSNCAAVMINDPQGMLRICTPIPMFHIFGFCVGLISPLLIGSECSTIFPFYFPDTLSSMKSISAYKCTSFRGPPTIFLDLLDHAERKNYDLSSLHTAMFGGSQVSPMLIERLRAEVGIKRVIIGYGMTETSLCASITTSSDELVNSKCAFESVGRPFPQTEIKLVDSQTREVVPIGSDGEICVRGFNVMRGYWDEREKTRETIDQNGWLRTGDIAKMDKDGYIYFRARLKDLIIRGGANIYPAEVENFLKLNDKILEVHVFGVPDSRLGEEICAWIKLKPNCSLNIDELKEYCVGKIAHFKVPKYMKIVDKYPLNASGKVLKREMAKEATKELNL